MDCIEKSCFFTGHRFIATDKKNILKEQLQLKCITLIEQYGVTEFICGGALGFDTLAAFAVLSLKDRYPQIHLHLYLPCTNQSERWSLYDQKILDSLKALADYCKYITNSKYLPGCMQMRNKAMVNDALYGIAYCTNPKSGTYSTLKYAKEKQRKIVLLS